ncbi:MAG: hypothetical protein QOC68_4638 [Solirubrobacteraceae bacterium]|nr:hypothetical protein [Solirubrobacteraceae bacterium]
MCKCATRVWRGPFPETTAGIRQGGDTDGPAHRVSAQGNSQVCGLSGRGQPVTTLTPYSEATVVNGVAQPVVPSVAITLPRIQALPALSMA